MTESTSTALTVTQRAAVALNTTERERALVELAGKSKVITVITNADGRQEAHAAAMALRVARVEIEKAGKASRDDATKFSKAVIAEEDRLVAIIKPEEQRLLELRDQWDAARERERQAKIEAEKARVAALREKIGAIARAPLRIIGMDANRMRAARAELAARAITVEEFAELADEAAAVRNGTLLAIDEAIEKQAASEAEAARLEEQRQQQERERAELERQRQEQEAREKAERERLAEQERQARLERERADAEAKAAREKADAESRQKREAEDKRLAEERAELERQRQEQEAREKAERERLAEQERQARLERERADAEAKAAREKADAESRQKREAEDKRLAEERAELARRQEKAAEEERQRKANAEAERLQMVTSDPVRALREVNSILRGQYTAQEMVERILDVVELALERIDAPAKAAA